MIEDVLAAVERVHRQEVPVPTGEADPSTLTGPMLAGWLADVHAALGRLLVSGLAHPDADLPPTFELLADRAAELGSPTSTRCLRALALWTSALQPGPPERSARDRLASHLWDELQRYHRWLRWFEHDLALSTAEAVSAGARSAERRDDLPRFSGRLGVDGLELERGRLLIHTHDEGGRAVLLVDRLAGEARPFEAPVLSRLFQQPLRLGELAASVVEVERHPFRVRGGTVVLEPDFRSVPRLRSALPDGRRAVEEVRLDARVTPDGLLVTGASGEEVVGGAALEANVLLHLASEAAERGQFEARVLRRRTGVHVLGIVRADELSFPHVDPFAWALDAGELLRWTTDADPLVQVAAQLHVQGVTDRVGAVFRERVRHWFLAWAGARLVTGPVAAVPDGTPSGVWLTLWSGRNAAQLLDRYTGLADPSPMEAAARAVLLLSEGGDREAARGYLQAHLDHVRGQEVWPSSEALLFLADALAWVDEADRAGPIVDALALDPVRLRRRLAWQIWRWRTGREAPDLPFTLGLAAASGRLGPAIR